MATSKSDAEQKAAELRQSRNPEEKENAQKAAKYHLAKEQKEQQAYSKTDEKGGKSKGESVSSNVTSGRSLEETKEEEGE